MLALRPLNTKYNARALWVHLDDGSGEPLCGERKKGWSLVPELIGAGYSHVCEPCREAALTQEAADQHAEDLDGHQTMVLTGLG